MDQIVEEESLATPGYAFYFRDWKGEPAVFTPSFLMPKAQRNIGLFVIYVAM